MAMILRLILMLVVMEVVIRMSQFYVFNKVLKEPGISPGFFVALYFKPPTIEIKKKPGFYTWLTENDKK